MSRIGALPGVNVGQVFPDRRSLHDADVHRGLQQGIGAEGTSIVLSGGYPDDVDEGDLILYTGEGGQDPDTRRQIADQTLTRGNAALVRHYLEGNPIRVVRGSRLDSPYAPASGYRYDGLYRIDRYDLRSGRDGYKVFQFCLVCLDEQPVSEDLENVRATQILDGHELGAAIPGRTVSVVSRVIRSTEVGTAAKQLNDYTCQICGVQLETPAGPYAECCHIRPLGKPHDGPDTLDNVLCLCPNCHVLFDAHAIHLNDDLTMLGSGRRLRIVPGHEIGLDHVRYHRNLG